MTDLNDPPALRPPEKRYLGDTVYVSFDGWIFRLDCEAPPCTIYLEPSVLLALEAYVRDTRAWIERMKQRGSAGAVAPEGSEGGSSGTTA